MNETQTGKLLKAARKKKGLTIQEAARETRIRDRYLEAIEAGNWDELPSKAQISGFLRNYSAFLELNLDDSDQEAEEPQENSDVGTESSDESGAASAADSKYLEIGRDLKERRELLALSVEEVASQTRISERYIEWIEAGQFDTFPSPTQARGMLNSYAGFLGLEKKSLEKFGEAVLDTYQETAVREERLPPAEVSGSESRSRTFRMPRWLRRYLSFDFLAMVGLSALLAGVFFWGIGQVASLQAAEEIPPTAPPLAAELLVASPSPVVEASATIASSEGAFGDDSTNTEVVEEVAQITIEVANPSGVELLLIASQREWMQVRVDGVVRFEGRTSPGENYSFSGNNEVIVFTGNASAFRAFLNEQDLGRLGIEGEVIELVFTRTGAATPSPTASPTLNSAAESATVEAANIDAATLEP